MSTTMKITSSWRPRKKRRGFIAGISSIIVLIRILGSALDGSLRVLYQIETHNNDGRSLLFPSYHANKISHYDDAAIVDNPYLTTMTGDKRLVRSSRHQSKFYARRKEINDTLPLFFSRHVLFPTTTTWWAAFNVNEEWGYVHVWKSGGTTIADQTKGKQVSVQELENRSKWMTFVRDPIDHFLSGYSECRFRTHEKRRVNELPAWNPAKYDHQIRVWLKEVKDATRIDKIDCHIHSFPQANFLIDKESKQFYPRIQAVGDMHELPAFLETIAKFPYNYQQGSSRVATENHVKMNYFPLRRDLLTEHTLQQICKFVSLDYYFFAFEPPDVCKTDSSILLTPETQQLLPILEKPERPSSRKEVVGEHDKYIRPFVRRPSPLAKMITLQKQHQDPKRLGHHQHVKLQQFLLQPQGGRRRQQQQQAVEQLDCQQKLLEERLARVKQAKETLLLQQEQQEQAKS